MEVGKFSSPLQQQLYDLLCSLHQFGRDLPYVLIQVTEMVQPGLQPDRLVTQLGKMFEEMPLLLQNAQQLQKLVLDPPSDLNTLRLLLDFRDFQQLVQQISYLQLLHLTNNIIPPGPQTLQLAFLQKAQEIFQSWSREMMTEHHRVLSETPLHMERQELLQREPQIPWELLHFLIEMLKLPINELYHFQDWISKLPKKHLLYIVQLIQLEPAAILEIKRRMDGAQEMEGQTTEMSVESSWNESSYQTNSSSSLNSSNLPPNYLPVANMDGITTVSPTKVSILNSADL
jgi:hypothetical protein